MAVEMNKSSSVRLTPVQEIKLAKPATELYIGQVLKTVVVTALTNNQVLININGQNMNAKASHQFKPGDLLEVKVIAHHPETVLEVQDQDPSDSILQSALLQTLPKQAPPTQLFQTLNHLLASGSLPQNIAQQIKNILSSITSLEQLPQQMAQAIGHSGLFMESILAEDPSLRRLKADLKAQCFKLLSTLPTTKNCNSLPPNLESKLLGKDPLPLPGAVPQPFQKNSLNMSDLPIESLIHILREQVGQVLARITANQINHLTHDNHNGFLIMLDLPVNTPEGIEVIPLMIEQHKASPMHPSKWCISFALSLSQLGDIQGTVSLNANWVDVKISAEQNATIAAIEQYQQEMNTIFSELGLKIRDWKLQLGLENNQIDVANLKLLDLRI